MVLAAALYIGRDHRILTGTGGINTRTYQKIILELPDAAPPLQTSLTNIRRQAPPAACIARHA
jgi:hypothetical protein